jgi:hypothetical protein
MAALVERSAVPLNRRRAADGTYRWRAPRAAAAKGLMGRGFAVGMAVAALPAYFLLKNLDRPNSPGLAIYFTVPLAGIGGLLGMGIAAGTRHPVVVYAAPAAPAAAPGAAALNLHCHLAPASAKAPLDCARQ